MMAPKFKEILVGAYPKFYDPWVLEIITIMTWEYDTIGTIVKWIFGAQDLALRPRPKFNVENYKYLVINLCANFIF